MNKVIEKILNDLSKEHGYASFDTLIWELLKGSPFAKGEYAIVTAEAMHRLAEHCYKEQREACNLEWLFAQGNFEPDAILNAPLASDKFKP